MKIFIILPVHLFEDLTIIKSIKPDIIYIIEDPTYFTKFQFHKIKLCYHHSTMKFYYDYLINNKFNVQYIDYNNVNYNNIVTKKVINDESEEDTQRLKHRVMCLEKQITSLAALILDNTTSKKNRSFLY